jgi:MFS family permease
MMIRPALEDKGKLYFNPVLAVALSFSSFSACVYFISFGFSVIKFSEHWKAVWVIAAAPLERPDNFFKGSKIPIIVYFIIPFFAVLMVIYSFSWGIFLAAVYVLPSFIGSLCYLSFYSALNMYFPFSLEPQEKKRRFSVFEMILGLIIFGIVMGIQYPAYLVHKVLYIALYSGTIVLGIIIFVIQEQRSNRRFGQFAMKNLQYESHL